ncbi:MAG: TonB-dependent receptor [Steroidobacteraceae bacterium]
MAVALALGGAMPALAADQAPAAATPSEDIQLEEVTVTGSRIVRRDLESSSPVVTVESQAFDESSTLAVESVLNQLPQFTPANTQFNTSDVFPTATSTPGISTVSLRGLGSNRTLVLVDGRRAQPANSTLVIDTNSIPSSALESVEIISGGASAVYGADALGGVTNFKLKNNFQGVDMQFRTGITEEGDGEENRVSLLLGTSLAEGRGNAMLGMEWTERGEVLATDRAFFRKALKDPLTNATSAGRLDGWQYEPSSTNAPSQAAANAGVAGEPAGYQIPRTTVFMFNPDGTLFKLENRGIGFKGDLANDERYKVAPNGQLIENNTDLRYSSPMNRYSLFGKAHFGINENVEVYSQVNFVNTNNKQVLQPTGAVGGFGASIPTGTEIYGPSRLANGNTNPDYLPGGRFGLTTCTNATGGCTKSQVFPVPADLAALLASRGPNLTTNAANPNVTYDPNTGAPVVVQGADSSWLLGGTFGFLPARTIENTTNLYQVLAGLRGKLPFGDWTWDAYTSHGATRTELDYVGFVSTARWRALATSPNFGKGYNATGAGSTASTCTSGLPVFSDFAISQDCINTLTALYTDKTRLTQDVVEATAQGGLFELPGGQIRAALGATWRSNDFEYLPDAGRESNAIFDVPVGAFAQANVFGSTTVKEVYGELLVPLLRGLPAVQNLELELGYRYSDYDTAGSVPTWKALFSWQPIDWVRLRGGYNVANRAPNINELFLDASSVATTLRSAEPCRSDTREAYGNIATNPNRAAVQALCSALAGGVPIGSTYAEGRSDGVLLQVNSGNRDLKSEKGKTWTVGAVFRSPFETALLSGSSLSVDWYSVKITDAISTISAQSAFDLCLNRDGASNPTYSLDDPNGICRNIERDTTNGVVTQVRSQYQNLGTIETSGIDANLNWRAGLSDMGTSLPGAVSANLSYNKTFHYKAQDYPTQAPLENTGTLGSGARPALYDWRLVTTLRYSLSTWDVALNWRHLPSIKSFNFVADPATTVQGAGAYDMFGLTSNWNLSRSLSVSAGIDNLFDRDPERVGAGQIQTITAANGGGSVVLNGSGSTNAQYYDVLGRRYFLNVKLRF